MIFDCLNIGIVQWESQRFAFLHSIAVVVVTWNNGDARNRNRTAAAAGGGKLGAGAVFPGAGLGREKPFDGMTGIAVAGGDR